jgi:hypothetical protein
LAGKPAQGERNDDHSGDQSAESPATPRGGEELEQHVKITER